MCPVNTGTCPVNLDKCNIEINWALFAAQLIRKPAQLISSVVFLNRLTSVSQCTEYSILIDGCNPNIHIYLAFSNKN